MFKNLLGIFMLHHALSFIKLYPFPSRGKFQPLITEQYEERFVYEAENFYGWYVLSDTEFSLHSVYSIFLKYFALKHFVSYLLSQRLPSIHRNRSAEIFY